MSEQSAADNDHGTERRECPFDGCGWSIEVEKLYPKDQQAREDAEHQAEMHFDREHRGQARVKVVLEREVSVHPKQSLSEIIDGEHDRMVDDTPVGYEVAYAVGEFLKEPDDCSTRADDNQQERGDSDE
jgi:hypothetical protein